MMIGVGSPTFCLSPFLETAELISRDFRLWEVLSEGEDRLDLIGGDIGYARESLGIRFQVHAPLSDVNIASIHGPMREAALNEIRHNIEMCHRLEIPLMTVHPGFIQGIAFLDKRKALERTRDSLKEIAAVAKANSVEVAVENLPANMNATCTSAADLLEAIGSSGLGLCFDLGHANTADQIDQMLELVGKFRNVHLHNNDGQWDQHNVIDDGTADIGKVVRILKKSYSGNIVIESTDLKSGAESKRKLEALLG